MMNLRVKAAVHFVVIIVLLCSVGSAQTTSRSLLFPSTQKYRNGGLPPANGRAGNAVIAVRALFGKDLLTSIELTTTGDIENPLPAPGIISKVQQKVFDGSDKLLYTINYNGLNSGGYVVETSDSLVAHQPFQLQANVEGIDSGTDVITLQETVKYRPDLSPTKLSAPQAVRVNRRVVINATVSELNGDVGASADCVLYVDNGSGFTAVDSAHRIWVDAGSTVACAFSYTFAKVGTVPIKVQVEDVNPGDYDSANNFVTSIVEVADSIPMGGVASVTNENRVKHDILDDFSTTQQIMHVEEAETKNQNTIRVDAQTAEAPGDFPFTVTYSESSNSISHSSAFALGAAYQHIWSIDGFTHQESCGNEYDDTSNLTVYLCNETVTSQLTGDRTYLLGISYVRMPGEVTYHSDGFCSTYDIYNVCSTVYSYYSWNTTTTSSWPGFIPFSLNSTYEIVLHLTSNSGATFVADSIVPIDQTSDINRAVPYTCVNTSYGHICTESDFSYVKTFGSITF